MNLHRIRKFCISNQGFFRSYLVPSKTIQNSFDQTTLIYEVDSVLNEAPSGSALFQECEHFVPILKPDPSFSDLVRLAKSLEYRNCKEDIDLDHMVSYYQC